MTWPDLKPFRNRFLQRKHSSSHKMPIVTVSRGNWRRRYSTMPPVLGQLYPERYRFIANSLDSILTSAIYVAVRWSQKLFTVYLDAIRTEPALVVTFTSVTDAKNCLILKVKCYLLCISLCDSSSSNMDRRAQRERFKLEKICPHFADCLD